MTKKTLQIDVIGAVKDASNLIECKIYIAGRCCIFYTSQSNYEALCFDGVFVRDGKEKDNAGVINTTKVFIEK